MRSFWGWGYEADFPDEAARTKLAARLRSIGLDVADPAPVPHLDAVTLADPRYAPPVELRAFGTTDKRERATHAYGRAYRDILRAFRGDFRTAPDWVFYPEREEQIVALYRFCERDSIALVPYGGGTSVVGGVELSPEGRFRGTACVDMTRMNALLEIDLVSRAARIQAGATGPRIASLLEPHGVSLRHYPQSYELSTLGGWIATRAAGHYATDRTRIDDFVESVRMITPAGVFETRRVPSSGAGPDAAQIVLGSEGAFGIVTEAWMRVEPLPRWRASASVSFSRFEDGVNAARALAQSGLNPSNCRLLDAAEAAFHHVSTDGSAVLLLAFESPDHPVEPWMERALSLATDLGGISDEPKYTSGGAGAAHDVEEASAWKKAFFQGPYLQSALISLGLVCDTFETACTWDRFDALHRTVSEKVRAAMEASGTPGQLACRFTHLYPDGPAAYFSFLMPGRRGSELEQWQAVKDAASDAILASGGTITHHHAVGRVHRPWWERERSVLFGQLLSAEKDRLDPSGILNPGCLLPSRI